MNSPKNIITQSNELLIEEVAAKLDLEVKIHKIPSATILPIEDLVLLKKYELHMYPDKNELGLKGFGALRCFFINHYSIVRKEDLFQLLILIQNIMSG